SFLTQQLNKRVMVLAAILRNLLVVMLTVVPFPFRLTSKAEALGFIIKITKSSKEHLMFTVNPVLNTKKKKS
ncbi:hypothetical protein ACQP3D_27565, partial [Escherichia coli]